MTLRARLLKRRIDKLLRRAAYYEGKRDEMERLRSMCSNYPMELAEKMAELAGKAHAIRTEVAQLSLIQLEAEKKIEEVT